MLEWNQSVKIKGTAREDHAQKWHLLHKNQEETSQFPKHLEDHSFLIHQKLLPRHFQQQPQQIPTFPHIKLRQQ